MERLHIVVFFLYRNKYLFTFIHDKIYVKKEGISVKKIIRIGILGVIALLLFTSCDLSAFIENEEGHKHTYSEEFTSEKTGH